MDHDQIYDAERAARLAQLLRTLAARIDDLQDDSLLLAAGPELMKIMGDARSELFHYEVRCTYDSPEIAESRRIVEAARRQARELDLPTGDIDFDDPGEDLPWLE